MSLRLAMLALLLPAAAAAQGSYGTPAAPPAAVTADPGLRSFHVLTVHLDAATGLRASASHPAEAFPAAALPGGGGLLLRQPDAEGNWSLRAFTFLPSQIIVRQGDRIALTFVDVQGPAFRIAVEGVPEPIAIRRGEARTVTLTAERPGPIGFRSLDHLPTMVGEILVLPR